MDDVTSKLAFTATFQTENPFGWTINQNFQTLIAAEPIAENITLYLYEDDTQLLQISLPDNTWTLFCNRPLEVEQVSEAENKVDVLVKVIH